MTVVAPSGTHGNTRDSAQLSTRTSSMFAASARRLVLLFPSIPAFVPAPAPPPLTPAPSHFLPLGLPAAGGCQEALQAVRGLQDEPQQPERVPEADEVRGG